MGFSERFIRRPVLSTVFGLLILLLGLQGITHMSIRQFPKVDETVITVTTVYPGASADVVQGFITSTIEKAVTQAEGVDYVTAKSAVSTSTVQVHMRLNADPNVALTQVIAAVQQVRGKLPASAEAPVIQKGTGFQFALMYLAARSTNMNPQQLTDYLERVIQPRFATVPGVANAQILGAQEFAMRIWLDPVAMAARNVTATDVVNAIRASNLLAAPGSTANEYYAFAIDAKTTLENPRTFGELPIRGSGNEVVRLRDVAQVKLGPATTDVRVSFNGREGVFLGIMATPEANPLDVAAGVRKELASIQNELPAGMHITLLYDSTSAISASIDEVVKTIAEASGIVVLVILLFLGSFRSVAVPIVTIPLSLIGVAFLMWALGYSLNTLTLLAMVLAIGLVVDDAIVVVENVHRHIEEGHPPLQAAIESMREITTAVVAMTITLAAVFAPIGFTTGITGSLFREFAFTLAGAVAISGTVALTISPMMSSRLLIPTSGRFAHFVDHAFDAVGNWYQRRLTGSLMLRPITLLIVVVLAGTTGFLFTHTSSELAPTEDEGALFSVLTAPQYATVDYTSLFVNELDKITKNIPEVDTRFSVVGFPSASGGFAAWVLKPWNQRHRSQAQIQHELQGIVGKVAGLQAYVFPVPSLPGTGGGLPISLVVQSTNPAAQVYEHAEAIKKQAMASGKFITVQDSLSFDKPQMQVTIDRQRAAALGVPVSDIANTLTLLVGGNKVAQFAREQRSYDIIPQVAQRYRFNPLDLTRYFVRNQSGAMVPLSSVVTVKEIATSPNIEQFNQLNSATLSALPRPGVTSGDGLKALQQIATQQLPAGYFIQYAGQSRTELEAGNTLLVAFGLAVIVIYLVLAATFESFRDPLIIMMAVPLSLFGATLFLNLGFSTINIYSEVGLITLVGLITKHGILMVQFANLQRELRGLDRRTAIIEAARIRLRPILMTTFAMVLGVVPLLISTGAGAKARFSMGLVIATGMSIGTIFTLFVVPMFYTFLSSRTRPVTGDRDADTLAPPHPAPAE